MPPEASFTTPQQQYCFLYEPGYWRCWCALLQGKSYEKLIIFSLIFSLRKYCGALLLQHATLVTSDSVPLEYDQFYY